MNDTISRQQTITALRALSGEDGFINAPHEVVTDVVRGLPPVRAEHEQTTRSEQTKTDKLVVKTGETCEDCISRQAAIDALHMHLMYRMGTDSNKKRLDEWINNLPSAQPEQQWIPCSEWLPEDYTDVLVWFEYFRYGDYNCLYQTYGIGDYSTKYDSWMINHETGWHKLRVIAWMPLPKPYKEEQNEID